MDGQPRKRLRPQGLREEIQQRRVRGLRAQIGVSVGDGVGTGIGNGIGDGYSVGDGDAVRVAYGSGCRLGQNNEPPFFFLLLRTNMRKTEEYAKMAAAVVSAVPPTQEYTYPYSTQHDASHIRLLQVLRSRPTITNHCCCSDNIIRSRHLLLLLHL